MSLVFRVVVDLGLLALALAMGFVILWPGSPAQGLISEVRSAMPDSGVTHPVTAVLLNFRGYDTLLEMLVLLLAMIGVRSIGELPPLPAADPPSPVLVELLRLLAPLLVLIAAYLLWRGSSGPGGAFQAGAVLSAAGVLWLLTERSNVPGSREFPLRLLSVLGVSVFVALGLGLVVVNGVFLDFPVSMAGSLILLIEACATVSIATTLVLLFVGARAGKT